jgi:outer membrane protein assembly factor BamD
MPAAPGALRRSPLAALALTLGLLLSGCGTELDETLGWSANQLYARARESAEDGNWAAAVKYFEKLEARYPYGRYAQQAQLEVAYAHYKDNDPIAATADCDRFIKLHPNHPNVDYAFYLKGLVNYTENRSLFAGLTSEDPAERDPKAAREAFLAFRELTQRFPDSKYTPDALDRMRHLINALAQHEVVVARWYMRRGAYVAATNRAQAAVRTYPNTPAVEEALAIMTGAYDVLGLPALRDDARRVLAQTYPESPWLKRSDEGALGTWWN